MLIVDKKHMDLSFLDHLCFFQTLGRIKNHITEKISLKKGPAIILKGRTLSMELPIHYCVPVHNGRDLADATSGTPSKLHVPPVSGTQYKVLRRHKRIICTCYP